MIPCKFSVLFIKMVTISNHDQKFIIYIFNVLFYDKLQLFLTHHVVYTSFICGIRLSKLSNSRSILESCLSFLKF